MSKSATAEDAGSLANWISAGRDDNTEDRYDPSPESIEDLRAKNEEARGKIKKIALLQRY